MAPLCFPTVACKFIFARIAIQDITRANILCFCKLPGVASVHQTQWQFPRVFSSRAALVEGQQNLPLQRYNHLVSEGVLRDDPAQREVMTAMDKLTIELEEHHKRMEVYQVDLLGWLKDRQRLRAQMLAEEAEKERLARLHQEMPARRHIFSSWLFRERKAERGPGRMVLRLKREKALDAALPPRPLAPHPPRGLYLFGSVGCGKTLLMDVLFETSQRVVGRRRRLHFHAAMLELHQRMHRHWRQQQQRIEERKLHGEGEIEEEDDDEMERLNSQVLEAVVNDFMGAEDEAYGASLLCFDEIQVVDVFTAVALPRLLGRLMEKGVVLVATSNRPPRDLNMDGLQRVLFERFVQQLEKQCQPILVDTSIDYRRANNAQEHDGQTTYLWPLNDQSQHEMEQKWEAAVQSEKKKLQNLGEEQSSIPVMFGRFLEVPRSCGGVARFTFDDLCNRPVSAADYIPLAQQFHTVFITNIPSMSMQIRDQARRFITLVDELYNHRCGLVCTAAVSPDELFRGSEQEPLVDFESLQFETAVEGTRLRRNVGESGGVAPLGASVQERGAIEQQLSGREEEFAFRRAISRLLEMQTASYLHVRTQD